MKYKKVTLMYFSPSGTTKKTLENIAKGLEVENIVHLDLTDFDKRWERRTFEKDELVLFGMPVYEGRLVVTAKEIFNRTVANETPCVPIVVYGNRAYEDALLELKNKSEKCGFKTIAAAAFIAEHSIIDNLATNRPDKSDAKKQIEFGKQISEKIEEIKDLNGLNIKVPGDFPYKESRDLPISPTADDKCNSCGKCVSVCPVKAIDPHKPSRTDNFRCILCGNCIKVCPENARDIRVKKLKLMKKYVRIIARKRKEPEIFI